MTNPCCLCGSRAYIRVTRIYRGEPITQCSDGTKQSMLLCLIRMALKRGGGRILDEFHPAVVNEAMIPAHVN